MREPQGVDVPVTTEWLRREAKTLLMLARARGDNTDFGVCLQLLQFLLKLGPESGESGGSVGLSVRDELWKEKLAEVQKP